jgi:NTE family protein
LFLVSVCSVTFSTRNKKRETGNVMMKNSLVLSGGGARGFAHLGVLQALDELQIHIDEISGTSAGAVVGAFYFAGHKPDEILKIISSYSIYHWARPRWRKPGFLNMEKIGELFSNYLPKTFEELDRPLTVAVTDILKGESMLLNSGPLVPAVCASACIPVLFEPVNFAGTQLVDGGILNNFPVEAFKGKSTKIIGVHVNPVNPVEHVHFKNMADRNVNLILRREVEDKKNVCTVFIEPKECGNYNMLDLPSAGKIMQIGYEATIAMKEQLVNLKS